MTESNLYLLTARPRSERSSGSRLCWLSLTRCCGATHTNAQTVPPVYAYSKHADRRRTHAVLGASSRFPQAPQCAPLLRKRRRAGGHVCVGCGSPSWRALTIGTIAEVGLDGVPPNCHEYVGHAAVGGGGGLAKAHTRTKTRSVTPPFRVAPPRAAHKRVELIGTHRSCALGTVYSKQVGARTVVVSGSER